MGSLLSSRRGVTVVPPPVEREVLRMVPVAPRPPPWVYELWHAAPLAEESGRSFRYLDSYTSIPEALAAAEEEKQSGTYYVCDQSGRPPLAAWECGAARAGPISLN